MDLNLILPVVVLYKTTLENCETFRTICNAKVTLQSLFVYDNSPTASHEESFFKLKGITIIYVHNALNPGLNAAYNCALQYALKNNYNWLLLMDQDTKFTSEYFESIIKVETYDMDVVAFMPVVKSTSANSLQIAPTKLSLGSFRSLDNYTYGKQLDKISGINSGTVINIKFLEQIGFFSANYPIDMLDHWYFREIYRRKKYVYLLESTIFQNLSVSEHFEKNMSIKRYFNFISVENNFFKTDTIFVYLLYKIRLLFRLTKQIKYRNKDYFKLTLKKSTTF